MQVPKVCEFLHMKSRNSSLRSKVTQTVNIKTSKPFPSAFLKTLCNTRGAPHLKPNFPFTDRVPSSRNYLANCDQVQRIKRNILFQKSDFFSFPHPEAGFRKRPAS